MLHIPGLFISESEERGRGVFTGHPLSPEDIIEVCPLILLEAKDVSKVHETVLHDYYFVYPAAEGMACIALGYGSLYNHSSNPNADVDFDLDQQQIQIRCLRPIAAGEEVLIDYANGEEGKTLWFTPQGD